MITETRILEPGAIEAPAGKIPYLLLPGTDLFAVRAERLRVLSEGHSIGDYLSFMALVADAQQEALARVPYLSLPLLDVQAIPLHPAWREGLEMILRRTGEAPLPAAAHEAIEDLLTTSEAGLNNKADRVLSGDPTGIPPRELPFIAAALQVYWAHLASSFREDAFGRPEHGGLCPVCGSYPVAGIVHNGGTKHGLRYLSCSLCSSQWHMVRIKCGNCEAVGGIDYFTLEGSDGAVKAETCADCNFYLKIFYLDKNPRMEASADDLATLSLDMLMHEEGKIRRGPNLLFHTGKSH